MSFLSSFYLWLLPLATLPFLIHLFYNRKFRVVEFSSIKFLKDLEIDSIKRVQLIEILLLIIRTLIIISLILMISKPILKNNLFSSYDGEEQVYCILALDDSFSMHRSNDLMPLSHIYLEYINNITSTLSLKSHLKIISLSEDLILYDDLVENFNINQIKVIGSYNKVNLKSFLSTLESEENKPFNKEVHLISDLQEYPYLDLPDTSMPNWIFFFHQLPLIADNLSITNVEFLNDFISINKNLQIKATIENNGLNDAKNALLILTIDGINVGQEQFDLKSNQIATHTFNTILDSFGEHRIKLEVIYDERVGDNTYLLGLDIPSDVKIGILAKDSKNYEFITNSLMAFKEKFQNLTIRYPSELISDQSIIATNDVNIIFGYNYIEENSLENPILDHLNSAGQTYIFPSLNQNITGKFDFFDFIGFNYAGIQLHNYSKNSYPVIKKEHILNSLLLKVFAQNKEDDSEYGYFQLFKHFSFNEKNNSNLMLNGSSLWNSLSVSAGKIELLGFSPNLLWSDLPIKASFISLVDYMIYSTPNKSITAYHVGDFPFEGTGEHEMQFPSGKIYTSKANLTDRIAFTEPGIYQASQNDIHFNLYVNNAKEELHYKKASEDLINQKFQNSYLIEKKEDSTEIILQARIGMELWKYFLYLAILLIIIEMVISNQFSRKK